MAVRTLYIVRHGEYDHRDPRRADKGKGLVEIGVRQSELTADRLADAGVEFTRCFCSHLVRARETAEVILRRFPGVPVQHTEALLECAAPQLLRVHTARGGRLSAKQRKALKS